LPEVNLNPTTATQLLSSYDLTTACISNNNTPETLATIEHIRKILWHHVGIIRSANDLTQANTQLNKIKSSNINSSIDLTNLIQLAKLTIAAAAARHESRGLHYRSDFPLPQNPYNTILRSINNKIDIRHEQLISPELSSSSQTSLKVC
jgi:aspartate oxidase